VTWGHKESDLAASVTLNVEGVDYIFIRSKSGAECNSVKGKVVGHTEVSNFAADLLGADVRTASALMLASQSGLRGALDEGPAAVSMLMAKLADFDLIDRLLENASKQLLLGSDAPIRGKIEAAKGEMEAAYDAMPPSDEIPMLRRHLEEKKARLQEYSSHLENVLIPATTTAWEAFQQAQQRNAERAALESRREQLQRELAGIERHLTEDRKTAASGPANHEIDEARAALARAENSEEAVKAFTTVKSLPAYPDVFWEGPKDSFLAELSRLNSELARVQSEWDSLRKQKESAKRELVDPASGVCKVCGSVLRSPEDIRAHNERVQKKIADIDTEIEKANAARIAVSTEIRALQDVQKAAAPFEKVAGAFRNTGWPVEIDDSVYPPRVTWTGEEPVKIDADAARQNLARLQRAKDEAHKAAGRVMVHEEMRKGILEKISGLDQQIQDRPVIDTTPLESAWQAALEAEQEQRNRCEVAQAEVISTEMTISQREKEMAEAKARVEFIRARLAEYEDDLKKIVFNNNLVKKLRTLKPAITDMLWNQVLAAVSTFFSQLRGQQSVVTKTNDGFRVNGQSVDSLSGSTLDILALAIRVALTKTFIPHASFIVLDEPAHGADETRTGNILGFLASVGFQQTLLASHDPLSEAVADNVIVLETP
jgi:DNA repair exonuclease SbcCD ATPase subunit